MKILKRKCAIAVAVLLVGLLGVVLAQSGRGSMHGYVAFADLSYNEVAEKGVHADIELRGNTEFNHQVYTAKTDQHGLYDIPSISMGQYVLKITSPGYRTYQTELYIPSDFTGSLAVMLKREKH